VIFCVENLRRQKLVHYILPISTFEVFMEDTRFYYDCVKEKRNAHLFLYTPSWLGCRVPLRQGGRQGKAKTAYVTIDQQP